MTKLVDPPPGRFVEVPVTVRFGDTDPFGVVYFPSYFRYCHHAIEDFFRHIGLLPRDVFRDYKNGYGLPIVSASLDFFRPVRYGELLRIAVYIVHAGNRALTFGFHFYHEEGGAPAAKGRVTVVTIDEDWRSIALPDRLRKALEPYLPPIQSS